jgi:hypothetical protein
MNDSSVSGFMCIVVCICRKDHAFNSQQYGCLGRSLNPECSLQRAMTYASHNTGYLNGHKVTNTEDMPLLIGVHVFNSTHSFSRYDECR